jgi:hypothetical protein
MARRESATSASLQPPEFQFTRDAQPDDYGGLGDELRFRLAVIERLDYMCQVGYLLARRSDDQKEDTQA